MTLERYIDRHLPAQLKEAFVEMMNTPTGRRLVESLARRKARYILDPTGILGRSAMTINLVRLIFIGKQALQDKNLLINSLAHEASHIEQKYIADSFEQEYRAFVTAAQVMTELGLRDPFGWDAPELQNLSTEQVADKIKKMFPTHPLYGMKPAITLYQTRGLRGLIELVKQAWALLRAVLR